MFDDALPAFRRQVSDASDATRTSGDGTPIARATPARDDEDVTARRPSAALRRACEEEAADVQAAPDEAHGVPRLALGTDGAEPAQASRSPGGAEASRSPGGAEEPRAPRAARSAESSAARRLRVVEATLRQREKIFEEQMEAQDKKLNAASAALRKSRSQVQSVTAQLGLKELEGRRLEAQVMQLRGLLVEKERRLQEALDEVQLSRVARPTGAAAAGTRPGDEAVKGDLAPAEDTEAPPEPSPGSEENCSQQPQETPAGRQTRPAVRPADEEQMVQLAKIAEELTRALEVAKEAEEDMKERLAETVLQLEHEQHWRARYETDLSTLRAQRDVEVTDLLAHVRKQDEELAWERQLVKGLQERALRTEFEEKLQAALERKRKGRGQWHPHLEV